MLGSGGITRGGSEESAEPGRTKRGPERRACFATARNLCDRGGIDGGLGGAGRGPAHSCGSQLRGIRSCSRGGRAELAGGAGDRDPASSSHVSASANWRDAGRVCSAPSGGGSDQEEEAAAGGGMHECAA
eukprot:68406-Rhodomonas_salina.1